MYDRDATGTSKVALVELCRVLRQYKNDMVLAGGWAPYFLTRGYFDHCGSIDIDFVLRPTIVERYEKIKQIMERLGYVATGSVFRFERHVVSSSSGIGYKIEVDFLTESEGAKRLSGEWLTSVQADLKACVIEGCGIVFNQNFEVELSATMPGNGVASAKLCCANIVASLTMKGLALYRLKDKDSYDIYSVAGFYGTGPKQASEAFMAALKGKGAEKTTIDAIIELREGFGSLISQGPSAVARFIGSENARTDAYQRVNFFLKGLSL
ncbi:MAG: nucleotidyl transferase AbiEii/AbiGii toxin family protein [Candidatus Bathyarchaeia archaeon]|jgi:hypothetical protein